MKKIKKIYPSKLVNAHKLILFLIIISGWNTAQAQEFWTLKQCIDTAQVYNKTLQINRNNIGISEQRQQEAKANLIPKITANADYKYFLELPTQLMPLSALNPQMPEGQYRNIQFGVPHNISANVQLMLPLYNPQVYGAVKNTKIANEMAQLQFQSSEEEVLYNITTLYYNAQILKHQLDFLEDNLVNTNKLLKNIQLLKEQLLAKGTDVSKVQLQREQLKTQQENASNTYIQILNTLKLTMGIALESELNIDSQIALQTELAYSTNTNLQVQLMNTQNKLLLSELTTLNRSRYLPTLHMIGSLGTSGFGYDREPNQFLDFYPMSFVGIQLSYPLFNGTVTLRKVKQKELEIANNELQAELIADKNKLEIENISRQKTVAQQTILNTENQIDLAQSIYDQTILQQKQGVASLTDVLLADHALREAQQHYLTATIEYLKADLELKKIMGQLSAKN